jgi:prolyl oligopeptidase PreP (S9A serine peptidase family)
MTADEDRSRPQARSIGCAGVTRRAVLAGGVASGVAIATGSARAQVLFGAGDTMPPAPQDGTTDIFHGITVPDPFRPLEDGTRADVRAWVAAQDQQGRAYLESLPSRRTIRKFFDSLLDYPHVGIPQQHGTRYFSYFNDGLANQSSYGMQEPLAAPRRTVIDASTLSSDGTVAITGAFPDRRGGRVAYLLSEAGSDRQTLRVRDVDSGRDLPVRITSCKHTSVAWFFNNTGFFYTRYPNENDPQDWDRHSHIVCTHPLVPGANERVIFRLPDRRDVYLRVQASYDARLLKITVWIGTSEKAGYYVAPLDDLSQFTEIIAPQTTGFFGSNWISEYGDPASEAGFRTLIGYSPVHNVRAGIKYPPLLVLTADSDDRVVPAHAYKFVATLKASRPRRRRASKWRRAPATASAMRSTRHSIARPTRLRSCARSLGGRCSSCRRLEASPPR